MALEVEPLIERGGKALLDPLSNTAFCRSSSEPLFLCLVGDYRVRGDARPPSAGRRLLHAERPLLHPRVPPPAAARIRIARATLALGCRQCAKPRRRAGRPAPGRLEPPSSGPTAAASTPVRLPWLSGCGSTAALERVARGLRPGADAAGELLGGQAWSARQRLLRGQGLAAAGAPSARRRWIQPLQCRASWRLEARQAFSGRGGVSGGSPGR